MKILAAILALLLIAASPAQTNKTDFCKKANAASGALYGDKDGTKDFYCSGAVFEKKDTEYLFLTAGHCVDDNSSWFFKSKTAFYVSFSEDEKGPFYEAKVLGRS